MTVGHVGQSGFTRLLCPVQASTNVKAVVAPNPASAERQLRFVAALPLFNSRTAAAPLPKGRPKSCARMVPLAAVCRFLRRRPPIPSASCEIARTRGLVTICRHGLDEADRCSRGSNASSRGEPSTAQRPKCACCSTSVSPLRASACARTNHSGHGSNQQINKCCCSQGPSCLLCVFWLHLTTACMVKALYSRPLPRPRKADRQLVKVIPAARFRVVPVTAEREPRAPAVL
jgi:hypothetical protein